MTPTPFLSLPLSDLLAAELAAGNRIAEYGGWGECPRLVLLARPFLATPADLPPPLLFREINDLHYWKSEIEDPATREMLACRF